MADLSNIPVSNPTLLDDELAALTLQMEEISLFAQKGKGKHREDQPPDIEVAFCSFKNDLEVYKGYLEDHKLAQSIGAAVHNDGVVITALVTEDIQACEDRRLAMSLREERPKSRGPPQSADTSLEQLVDGWRSTCAETIAANSVVEFSDDEGAAGPSMTLAERQANVLGKLSAKSMCSVCRERYYSVAMVNLQCEHRYCIDCVKEVFMRATRDEALFPPRCCKKVIPPTLVTKHMSTDELQTFEIASVEFTTTDRVYCSNHGCGKFILPGLVDAGTREATCGSCGTRTCCLCKNGYHKSDDCPDDPAIRETRGLALQMGWQTCPSCKRILQLRSGCNHMTCPCKAEFCYLCGVKWKNCPCAQADEGRMLERAEEVVDRDAEPDLPLAERNRRVHRVQAELRENHECEHPGRFQRIFGAGRRGFQCEMCDARHWKYILQCRHCYVNVCEDCRRNRI